MIAQAAPTEQTARTIGVCHLIENPPSPPGTAVNAFIPVGDINIYFDRFENREIGSKAK